MKYGKSKVLIFEIISRPAELIKYILSYYGCVDRFMQFTDACATLSRKLKLGNVLNYSVPSMKSMSTYLVPFQTRLPN